MQGKRDWVAEASSRLRILDLIERLPSLPQLLVINYHRIGNWYNCDFDRELFSIDQKGLLQQLEFLKRNYQVIDAQRALEIIAGKARPKGTEILLTFDDGYKDNVTLAAPVLKKADVSGLFFLATGFLNDPDTVPWWDQIAWTIRQYVGGTLTISQPERWTVQVTSENVDRVIASVLQRFRQASVDRKIFLKELEECCGELSPTRDTGHFMDWNDATSLLAEGMAIGLHTHSHQILAGLDVEAQAAELRTCRRILAEKLDYSADLLAYPVGTRTSFSQDTKRLAQEAGFQAAFSFYGGTNRFGSIDPFDVRRVSFPRNPKLSRSRMAVCLKSKTASVWF